MILGSSLITEVELECFKQVVLYGQDEEWGLRATITQDTDEGAHSHAGTARACFPRKNL